MNDVIVPQISPEFLQIIQPVNVDQLETYEDHLAAAIEQLMKKDSSSWGLADVFVSAAEKFGESSQMEMASQLGIPRSTITNYTRTARAFTPDKRLADVSFTHHMEASFSDSFDDQKKLFNTQHRFDWVQKAANEKLRTGHLKAKIKQEKQKQELNVEYLPCYWCDVGDQEVWEYAFLARDPHSSRRKVEQLMLHQKCYDDIRTVIEEKRKHE